MKLTFAQRRKINLLLKDIPKDSKILEVGSGSGWLGKYLKEHGWEYYAGLDLAPPADIVGDIRNWESLGITRNSYDVIIALEVVEHVPAFSEFYEILKPEGILLLTSPVPYMDWLCKILEFVGINQKRTSPHDYLIYFDEVPLFEKVETWKLFGIVQVGKFRKPLGTPPI